MTGTSVTITHGNGRSPDQGEQLQKGQLYAFAIRAVNARGESGVSNRDWATPQGGAVEQDDANSAQQSPPEEATEETTQDTEYDTPLTASVDDAPTTHDGETAFTVRIAFSKEIATSYKDLDDGFEVAGGSITKVKRADGRNDLWNITVEPSGYNDIRITLEGSRDCSVTGAPCTEEGQAPAETLTFTVSGVGEAPPPPLTARIDDFPIQHDGPEHLRDPRRIQR